MYVTPCVSICRLDPITKVCIGCNRTKEEIDNWSTYSSEKQYEIMKRLGYGKRKGRYQTYEERLRRYDRG